MKSNKAGWLALSLVSLLIAALLGLKLTKSPEPENPPTEPVISTGFIDIGQLVVELTDRPEERQRITETFCDIERVFHGDWFNLFSENRYVTVMYNSAWQENYPVASVTVIFSVLEPKRKIENKIDWLYWPKNHITFSIFFHDHDLKRTYNLLYASGPADYPDYSNGSGNPVGLAGVWSKTINIRDRNYWKK